MLSNRKTAAAVDMTIRPIKNEEHDRVLDFLRIHYYPEEPLTVGCEPKEQEAEDEEFSMSNLKHGTCLMAVRNNQDGDEEILGVLIAGPKDCHEYEHLVAESNRLGSKSKWGKILKALSRVERDANVFERYNVESAVHVHVMAASRNARGLGIGFRLMEELIALARKLNFQAVTSDSTNKYTARINEKLGMECLNTLRYEDYRDDDGNQVFRPPPPHDAIRTFALRLSN